MSELLNRYFERELSLLRRSGEKFKEKHTDAANSMHLNEQLYEDPSITRLIESVALLSAKNEMKLDQQLPHISNALCSLLYPSFNQLLPSLMSVDFIADNKKFTKAVNINKGEMVKVNNQTDQLCQFELCHDTIFSPLILNNVSAQYAPFPFDLSIKHDANAVIQLTINAINQEELIVQAMPDNLSLYVNGFGQGGLGLIELLLSQLKFICISDVNYTQQVLLEKDCFKPCCINNDFLVLDKKGNEFSAYQMMLEYFNYPEKRKYFNLQGIKEACQSFDCNEIVISFFVKDIPVEYIGLFDIRVFQLNTTIVINQFTNRAEPIYYQHQQLSVPLVADVDHKKNNIEIIAVEKVNEVKPDGEYPLQALFSTRYFDNSKGLRWFSEKFVNGDKKFQHHLQISFDVRAEQHNVDDQHLLTAQLLCCNAHAPCTIIAGTKVEFSSSIELAGQFSSHNIPTVPIYPNESQQLHWKLIELLSTNFSSLINVDNPTDKLKRLLSVFNRSVQQQELISSIQKVSYQQKVARIYLDGVNIFTSGTLIKLDLSIFDRQHSMSVWLFAHLLNQFFACFCSFDRFITLEVNLITDKGEELLQFEKQYGSKQCL